MRLKYLIFVMIITVFSSVLFATEENIQTEERPAFTVTPSSSVFVLKLKSNPTTGYTWSLVNYNPALIEPMKHKYEANADKKRIGAPGYEYWTFRVRSSGFTVPQQTQIEMIYARPWEANDATKPTVFKITTTDVPSASRS